MRAGRRPTRPRRRRHRLLTSIPTGRRGHGDRQPRVRSRKRLPGFRHAARSAGRPRADGRARAPAGRRSVPAGRRALPAGPVPAGRRIRPARIHAGLRAAGLRTRLRQAGYGQPGYGAGPPTAALPAAGGSRPRGGRGLGTVAAVGLVAALLGGGVGGYVGYESARAAGTGSSTGVLAEPLPPADPNATPLSPVEAVAARVLPSVVQLQVQGVRAAGEGSGIVLSADGLLLTNNHVVEAAANGGQVVALFQDGTSAPAQIVGRDPSSDLAVLRAQGVSGLTPVTLGNSDSLRVGQQVVAFGAPLGLGGTVTTGIISALNRAVSVGQESGASEATVLSARSDGRRHQPGQFRRPARRHAGRIDRNQFGDRDDRRPGWLHRSGFRDSHQPGQAGGGGTRTDGPRHACRARRRPRRGRPDLHRRNDRAGHSGWPGGAGRHCGPARWSPGWTTGSSPMGTNWSPPFETMRRAIASP